MKHAILLLVLAVINATNVNAQSNRFEIELDPLAYALGGISGHAAYTFKNQRLQMGYAQLTVPEFGQQNEGITESFRALPSLKWDYFFGKEDPSHGFFAGFTADYLFWKFKSETDEHKDGHLNLGIRAGYKFDLFKKSETLNGLYLTPWVGYSYATSSEDYTLDNTNYSRNAFTLFPTFHLGWSF